MADSGLDPVQAVATMLDLLGGRVQCAAERRLPVGA